MFRHVHSHTRVGARRRMRGHVRLTLATLIAVLTALAGMVTAPAAGASGQTIAVDGTSPGRTFDGVGALSAGASSRLLIDYPEPQRSQVLDYMFKPGYGAALQVLKVEIGGDTNSTDGTEPSHMRSPTEVNCDRGYEWWLMEQAKQRNPGIQLSALAWGAPGWVGGGQQTMWTDQYTSYLLSWLGCAAQHGLGIDYLGGWNERGFDATWYKKLRTALNAHGYGYIKIMADDSGSWTVADAMAADPAFASSVDAIGQHYVCGYLSPATDCPSSPTAQSLGKPLWASEQGSQPYDTGAGPLARAVNRQYTDGRITGTINWALEWSAYQGLPFPGDGLLLANEPWSGHYIVGPSVWAVAQTTQFTRIGWRYLDSGSTRIPGGSVVSLRAPNSGDWSSIAETLDATAPQQVTFAVSGGLSAANVHSYATNVNSTNPADWFVQQPDIQSHGGTFTVTLQPGRVYSFSTTDRQGKGAASSPAAPAWSLPYHDNFDSYPADSTPRFFSDIGGTFATAPCQGGRAGMCLRSVVGQEPVRWTDTADRPLTVVGDPVNWHNYHVNVDALMEQSGSVDVGGRVVNGVSGYHLTVASAGHWTLTKVTPDGVSTTLASGTGNYPVGTWHHLSLDVRQIEVDASIDGKRLAAVGDATYDSGQVSLAASAWQNVEFDNLEVTQDHGVGSKLSVHDVTPSPAYIVQPGDSVTVSAKVTNPGPVAATDLTLAPRLPAGWTATEVAPSPRSLAPGETGNWSWRITSPSGAAAQQYQADLALSYRSGGQIGGVDQNMTLKLGLLPHAGMTATSDSAQEPDYDPRYAIDDDPNTLWHSQYSPYQPMPHEITVNLGASDTVSGLQYQPRQDGNVNGDITSYAVLVSNDGTNFTQVANGSWAGDASTKSVAFPAQPARYVRLQALAGVNDFAAAAEINIVGRPAP